MGDFGLERAAPTTYANLVGQSKVMPLIVNCASTWANQRDGSPGQYGKSLMLIADVTVGKVDDNTVACELADDEVVSEFSIATVK